MADEYHLVQQGRIGEVRTAHVNHPGTNDYVNLPPEPVPDGLDWDLSRPLAFDCGPADNNGRQRRPE